MTLEQTISQWKAEEEAVRTRIQAPGIAPTEQFSSQTGMETFAAMFAGELPPPPMAGTLNFIPVRIERGIAVFQGRPQREHYNTLGTVHGGWYAAILDSAVGCAVHSTRPAGKIFTTLELKVNMVRPLTDSVPLVRAEGRVIHPGRQVTTAEGEIIGPDGKLYAHATTTCLIFELG